MVKIIIASIVSILLLSGCQTQPPKIEYQTVNVPVYYVPSPPKVSRPTLYSSTLTDDQKNDIGELSKAFGIDNVQLKLYACVLESIVNEYAELSQETDNTNKPASLSVNDATQTCLKQLPPSQQSNPSILQATRQWLGL